MTPAARLVWVRRYERTGDAGLTCRRCGVSRPTLRKWWRRYRAAGVAGLEDRSRRPHNSLRRRVHATEERCILDMRRGRNLGIKRLRNELIRQHGLRLAIDTIHKVLCRHGMNRLHRPRLIRKGRKRYSRPIPGDRVQMSARSGRGSISIPRSMTARAIRWLACSQAARRSRPWRSSTSSSRRCRFPSSTSRPTGGRSSSPARFRTS